MHRKGVFALSGVFLAIALVVPPTILILQSSAEIATYSAQDNPGHQTSGNYTATDYAAARQTSYIVAGAIEAVFVALFAVTLYYGINHVHPGQKPPEE
jgi:hypothetical protein